MFRVSFYVDDRKLADALRSLAGTAYGQPEVQPVINAEKATNGTLVARTDGSIAAQFIEHMRKNKLANVNAAIAKDFLKANGRSPQSATYLLTQCVKLHALKRSGKGSQTTYAVL